jgi:hypothetical protein
MLKIKDNVDLKELEKYGFEKATNKYIREYADDPDTTTTINIETRELKDYYKELVYDWGDSESVLVEDLRKDGLVEEV